MIGAVPEAQAVSVFASYRGRYRTVRAARFTPDTASLIAAEPGVLLRERRGRHEVFTGERWHPLQAGQYVVRHGHDPSYTAVSSADYFETHYTREAQ